MRVTSKSHNTLTSDGFSSNRKKKKKSLQPIFFNKEVLERESSGIFS